MNALCPIDTTSNTLANALTDLSHASLVSTSTPAIDATVLHVNLCAKDASHSANIALSMPACSLQ